MGGGRGRILSPLPRSPLPPVGPGQSRGGSRRRSRQSHGQPDGQPLPAGARQNDRFQAPAREAQVSSRLDGSTVFTVCPGPLLASILASFWDPVGTHGLHYCRQRGSGAPRLGPIGASMCPSGGSRCCHGGMLRSFDGFRHPLRTLRPLKWRPKLPKSVQNGCFFDRVQGSAEIRPQTNRGSSPLSKGAFCCCLWMMFWQRKGRG